MQDNLSLPDSTYEREFWKRYSSVRQMIREIRRENQLLHQIRDETVIPDQARDMAVTAMLRELSDKHQIFLDFFHNFISFSAQGLHRTDLQVTFTVLPGGIAEIEKSLLFVDGRPEEVPVEIGQQLVDFVPYEKGWEAILAFYRKEETRFDRLFGANLERCALVINKELFPTPSYSVTMRLPAQILVEQPLSPGSE